MLSQAHDIVKQWMELNFPKGPVYYTISDPRVKKLYGKLQWWLDTPLHQINDEVVTDLAAELSELRHTRDGRTRLSRRSPISKEDKAIIRGMEKRLQGLKDSKSEDDDKRHREILRQLQPYDHVDRVLVRLPESDRNELELRLAPYFYVEIPIPPSALEPYLTPDERAAYERAYKRAVFVPPVRLLSAGLTNASNAS